MKEILTPVYWLPFVWIIFQAYLFLSMGLFILRWKKMLISPVAGMEYGHILAAGSILIGTLIISTGAIGPLFQAAKTLQYSGGTVLRNTLLKFTEFFLVGTLSTGLFIIAAILNQRVFFRKADDQTAHEGNLSWGILVAFLNIGTALVFWFWVNELAIRITPEFVNIR